MPKDFRKRFPSVVELRQASPALIGAAIIDHIQLQGPNYKFHIGNFSGELRSGRLAYPPAESDEAVSLIAEGIQWAIQNFLAVPDSQNFGSGWMILTRWGNAFQADHDVQRAELRRALPDALLHPEVKAAALDIYHTGRFEAAVFEAFKLVEIAVRKAAGFTEADYGTDMIARAFNPEKGPLSDFSKPDAERQGMMRFMSGAHAVFKNPRSHRDLDLTDPAEAAEMLVIAGHMLRVVEARIAGTGSATA